MITAQKAADMTHHGLYMEIMNKVHNEDNFSEATNMIEKRIFDRTREGVSWVDINLSKLSMLIEHDRHVLLSYLHHFGYKAHYKQLTREVLENEAPSELFVSWSRWHKFGRL